MDRGRAARAGPDSGWWLVAAGAGLHAAGPLVVLPAGGVGARSGPTLCGPWTIGRRDPALDLWWFLLPALVTLGILAARRAAPPGPQRPGQPDAGAPGMSPLGSALLPAVCGLCLAAQYLFMINYAAPRFLLPAYALLAIPAADGLAFLVTRTGADLRPAVTAVVACFLVVQLVAQHLVVDHEAGGTVAFHGDYAPSIRAIPAEHPADDNGVEVPRSVCGRLFPGIAYEPGDIAGSRSGRSSRFFPRLPATHADVPRVSCALYRPQHSCRPAHVSWCAAAGERLDRVRLCRALRKLPPGGVSGALGRCEGAGRGRWAVGKTVVLAGAGAAEG